MTAAVTHVTDTDSSALCFPKIYIHFMVKGKNEKGIPVVL